MYRFPLFLEPMADGGPLLLAAKLALPQPTAQPLPRPALVAWLEEATRQRLTLLVGPAGYGKSTLLSEWGRATARPIAWLSLDAADDALPRLLAYLTASLNQLTLAPASPATGMAGLLRALAQAEARGPFALVLDGTHHLRSEEARGLLAALVEHLPPQATLVCASREALPLPLARLRAAGQLAELPPTALLATPAEAATLLARTLPVPPVAATVCALHATTGGWWAPLHLAALALRDGSLEGVTLATHPHLAAYLEEEVLGPLPPTLSGFLLRLAAPGQPTVVDQGFLRDAQARGLVERDGSGGWHLLPLLGAFLRQRQLAGEHPLATESLGAEPLTAREEEILQLLPANLSSRQIADRLVVEVSTVRWYMKQIYRKLGAHSRREAIARAQASRLLG